MQILKQTIIALLILSFTSCGSSRFTNPYERSIAHDAVTTKFVMINVYKFDKDKLNHKYMFFKSEKDSNDFKILIEVYQKSKRFTSTKSYSKIKKGLYINDYYISSDNALTEREIMIYKDKMASEKSRSISSVNSNNIKAKEKELNAIEFVATPKTKHTYKQVLDEMLQLKRQIKSKKLDVDT